MALIEPGILRDEEDSEAWKRFWERLEEKKKKIKKKLWKVEEWRVEDESD